MNESDEVDVVVEIRRWLEDQGYPLELRVAHEFRRMKAQVVQSEYYADPETETSREIDVSARYHSRQAPKNSDHEVVFVIECKSSARPWVVFTAGVTKIGPIASVVQRSASPLGQRFLESIARVTAVQQLFLLQAPGRPAYGVTEAFTSGTDVPYKAIMSAAKAARSIALKYEGPQRAGWNNCIVAFPVVVLGGRLFECELDREKNSLRVAEISQSTLLWRNPIVARPHTIVSILTAENLRTFVRQANHTARALLVRMNKFASHNYEAHDDSPEA